MNSNRVLRFIEENAVITDAQAEQSFKFAAKRLHLACTGFGVTVNCLENMERSLPVDGADLRLHIRLEADELQSRLVCLLLANLVHSEPGSRNHVFKGDTALWVLQEVFA